MPELRRGLDNGRGPIVEGTPNEREVMPMSRESARELVLQTRADGRESLTAAEAATVCDAYGIPVPLQRIARNA